MKFNDLPFKDRPDLTPYLIHFTKNTKRQDKYGAYENLVNILKTGKIWGSNTAKGFIKGPHEAACFMDVPFSALKYVLNEENSNPDKPRYEPYGIFVSKKIAYERGVRPVLYLSNEEQNQLKVPKDELWRVVRFEAEGSEWISWMHEREWRCKGSFKLPTNDEKGNGIGVLVKNYREAKQLQKDIDENPDEYKIKINSIIPLIVICQGLYI